MVFIKVLFVMVAVSAAISDASFAAEDVARMFSESIADRLKEEKPSSGSAARDAITNASFRGSDV